MIKLPLFFSTKLRTLNEFLFGRPPRLSVMAGLELALQQESQTLISIQSSKDFYASRAWQVVRYKALKREGGRCQCCGRSSAWEGVILHVDHIKPRSKYPQYALCDWNLQVLCEDCNLGKGAWDVTDWRRGSSGVQQG
jgi:hypothetical protein